MTATKSQQSLKNSSSDDLTVLEASLPRNSLSGQTLRAKMRLIILWVALFLGILVGSIVITSRPSISQILTRSNSPRSRSSSPSSVPSMDEIVSYVHLAYAAFCPEDTLQKWTCLWCLDEDFQISSVLYNETTQTRGFVGFNPSKNLIVASFRGSQGNANWILDLEPGTTNDFYGVTVRKGWVTAYDALREQLWVALHQIHELCPTCATFVTTGHSLGAAISGLAALDVKLSLPWIDSAGMRNFGMPRLGYKDFSQLFHEHVESPFRVVHYRDIVPHYPLRVEKGLLRAPFHYHHVGSELWEPLKQFNGTLVHCDGSGEDPHCSDSVPLWHWDPDDHMTYMGIPNNNCKQ